MTSQNRTLQITVQMWSPLLWCFHPDGQLNPTQILSHSPSSKRDGCKKAKCGKKKKKKIFMECNNYNLVKGKRKRK